MDKKVVILAGGRGSRMGDATDIVPKPMVKIGDIPIIQHIMTLFRGCEFIVAAGYKKEIISEYFQGSPRVTVLDTGLDTQTAGRLKKVSEIISLDEPFYVCYGDGLTDFPVLSMELKDVAVVNMLAVHPIGRFGEIHFSPENRVTQFSEKPIEDRWINGGFFLCHSNILNYIETYEDVLETDVFSRLIESGKLFCTLYDGFWHCMDTPKDHKELNEEYKKGSARWLK
jgi:glucose-1-phosphate cytidylyltransferase